MDDDVYLLDDQLSHKRMVRRRLEEFGLKERHTQLEGDDNSSTWSWENASDNVEERKPLATNPLPVRELGLSRRTGYTRYDDYDVITVHGARDDPQTAWTSPHDDSNWILDKLFKGRKARQMDFVYDTSDAARIYDPSTDGIAIEADLLLNRLAEDRTLLPDTENDRPIIWICHDLGGSIVKQALVNAMYKQPDHFEPDEDPDYAEACRRMFRRLPLLTSSIIFLGCPHNAKSNEELVDQLFAMMFVPGPPFRTQALDKIRNLARQIERVNLDFLESNVSERAHIINITSGPAQHKAISAIGVSQKAPHSVESEMAYKQDADNPFSSYIGHMFPNLGVFYARRVKFIDHLGLVRGTWPEQLKSQPHGSDWVNSVCYKFESLIGYNIKNCVSLLAFQNSLLSLSPPTQAITHTRQFYVDNTSEPCVPGPIKWIMEHEFYKTIGNPNLKPQIVYVHAGKKVCHIIDMKLVSQQLSFAHDSALAREIGRPSMGCFYFEFDRYDSRRNGIKAMINSFICTMACRFWDCEHPVIRRCADYLSRSKSWALEDMLNLFTIVHRSCHEVNKMTIILAQFDHCDERERMRFIYTMFWLQQRSEKLSRFILTTARPDDLLCEKLPLQSVISLDECPLSLAEFIVHLDHPTAAEDTPRRVPAKRPKSTQLAPKLNRMFKKFGKSPGSQDQVLEEPPNERPESPSHRLSISVQEPSSGTHQKLLRGDFEQLKEPTQKLMRSVYSWIRHAAEPLTPEALTEAIQGSVPQEMEDLGLTQGPQAFAEFVQTTMRGIIVRRGRDLRFSDDAFYDVSGSGMFQDDKKLAGRSNADMATVCLRYLLGREGHDMLHSLSVEYQGLGVHDLNWSPITLPRHNLGSYALRFWAFHYQAAGAYRPTVLATELFEDEQKMRVWTEALYVISNPFTRIQKEYVSPLPYMAMFGLDDLVRSHIQNETSHNCSNQDRWLAIVEAARNGHRKTVVLLLEQADTDHAGLAEAIHWAANKCEKGEEEGVLDCLISKARRAKDFCWPPFILNRAAATGLMNLVSVLIKEGYDLNETDSTGKTTAVHTAIKFSQPDVLKALVDSKRVDLTLKDEDGETPLALATRTSSPTVIMGLERAGATFSNQMEVTECFYNAIRHGNFNSLAWFFVPAPKVPREALHAGLLLAAHHGFTECVRILLVNGANPNSIDRKGQSALSEAVWRGRLEICRMLLEKGADPNQLKANYVPKIGIAGSCRAPPTLLLLAIWNKSPPLVSMLLDHGAKINGVSPDKGGDLPLSVAVMTCNMDIVDLLLARGADPNLGCSCWERAACPPLIVASMYGVELVEKLINHGAKVPGTVAASGLSPLHVALTTNGHKSSGLLKVLLTNGADINATEDLKYTPLMSAATLGHIQSVEVLLEQTDPKADLEVVSSREPGRTALHLALRDGHPEIVKLLVEAGADIDRQQSDGTPPPLGQLLASDKLHSACEDLLEFMLKWKPNLGVADNEGNTILHNIRSDTPLSVVIRLVVEGAPVNTFNELGYSPLACAVKCGNADVARYLTTVKGVQSDVYHAGFGSILHIAAGHCTVEVVRQLIRTGAEHSLVNAEFGESILYSTIGNEDKRELRKTMRYLVEEVGVDVNALGGGWGSSLLRTVAEAKGTRLLKYLLSHGARTNQVDSLGRTAAHWAVINQRLMDLETLVEFGADISVIDNFGRSPLHFAASKADENILRYILGELPDGAANENSADVDGWTPLMWAVKSGPSSMAYVLIDEYEADACARSKDEEWSPLKIARLSSCSWSDDYNHRYITGLKRRIDAQGCEDSRVSQDDKTRPGACYEQVCAGCDMKCIGETWSCKDCQTYLCFKCIRHSAKMHYSDHMFVDLETQIEAVKELGEAADEVECEGGSGTASEDEEEDETESESEEEEEDDSD